MIDEALVTVIEVRSRRKNEYAIMKRNVLLTSNEAANIAPASPDMLTLMISVDGHRLRYAGSGSISTDHRASRSVM